MPRGVGTGPRCDGRKNEGGVMDAPKILRAAWELREGPAVFSTVDKNGLPNSVYVLSMKLLSDGRIAIMDNYFHKFIVSIFIL